ncbi:hypothetical protein NUW54_g4377 [Trametes sanguinea]|uniref:Uncharacterized protein n=2 Tax=Trametes sanguinea TaxID=158606 RepID=A0ACC1Q0L9_9APHY|nr:hypothetical protein NUW54_g7019 [Trametes sanguinea]KAJ3005343.1 hypothetical protein NUW54_g4377 [Trametes sanguinea]
MLVTRAGRSSELQRYYYNGHQVHQDPSEVLDEQGAKAVVVALTTFVEVHQALLNVVIGKHSIASRLFFTAPVAAVLRSLEAAIDALAFALIGLIPTEKDHANAQFALLAVTLDDAEDTYQN